MVGPTVLALISLCLGCPLLTFQAAPNVLCVSPIWTHHRPVFTLLSDRHILQGWSQLLCGFVWAGLHSIALNKPAEAQCLLGNHKNQENLFYRL